MSVANLLTTKGEQERDAIRERIIAMSDNIPLSRLTVLQLEQLNTARGAYAGGYQVPHLIEIEQWLKPIVKNG